MCGCKYINLLSVILPTLHMHMHMHMHMLVQMHMHTCTSTRKRTHAHTHAHARARTPRTYVCTHNTSKHASTDTHLSKIETVIEGSGTIT